MVIIMSCKLPKVCKQNNNALFTSHRSVVTVSQTFSYFDLTSHLCHMDMTFSFVQPKLQKQICCMVFTQQVLWSGFFYLFTKIN